jgi:hypothetical protein
MDELTTPPTPPLTTAAWVRFLVAPGPLLRTLGRVTEPASLPPAPLAPPPGWHWKVFVACGPLLIVVGVLLRWLGHAGTGAFIAVIGACVLSTHLYMRFRALDVVDGFHTYPWS